MVKDIEKRILELGNKVGNPFTEKAVLNRIVRLCCNQYLQAEGKLSPKEWMEAFNELTEDYDEEKAKRFKGYIQKEVKEVYERARDDNY